MIRSLLKVRFIALFSGFLKGRNGQRASRGRVILVALLFVYLIAIYAALFGTLFYGVYPQISQIDAMPMYWAMAGAMALMLSFMFSVFATQSQLFDARDNELLLSMPIRPSTILLSRMLTLYCSNLAMTALVLVPAVVALLLHGGSLPAMAIVSLVTALLLMPLGALALSCLFGWLLSVITSRMRRKSLFTMALTLIFFFGYFYLFNHSEALLDQLVANADQTMRTLSVWGYPAWQLGLAAEGSIAALLKLIACCVVPFAAATLILSLTFIGIATRRKGAPRVAYRAKAMRARSVDATLLCKELKHFFSSAAWLINGGFGLVLMPVLPILFAARVQGIMEVVLTFSDMPMSLPMLLTVVTGLLMSMTCISSAAVSIEGKALWVTRAMPVDAARALIAKARLQMAVCAPMILVTDIVIWATNACTVWDVLVSLLVPLSLCWLISCLGVALNVHFPRLNWESESAAVKQGMSVILTMLIGMLAMIVPLVVYFGLLSRLMAPTVFMTLLALVYSACALLLRRRLTHGLARRFEAL